MFCKHRKVQASQVILLSYFIFRCGCGKCSTELLESAREYRCCNEVLEAIGKVTFEGGDERCLTETDNFKALVNREVLLLTAPLLKTREGKKYKKHANENE